jgi:hypothetical protein
LADYLISLMFGCKEQQKQLGAAGGNPLAKGQSGNAAGPTGWFHEPGQMGCRVITLPNSVRLAHNFGNLACCPDFNVSHYRSPAPLDLDAAPREDAGIV